MYNDPFLNDELMPMLRHKKEKMLYHPISHSKAQIRLDSVLYLGLTSRQNYVPSIEIGRVILLSNHLKECKKMAPTYFLYYKEHEHIRPSCLAHSDASNDTSHRYDTFGKHLTWG